VRLPRRLLFFLAIPLPVLIAACGGGGSEPAPRVADASEIRSESIIVGATTVEEKSGVFGPDLGFVLRLPESWNGRLLVAIPGAAGLAGDLDDFATPEVVAGTVYASIDSSDALSAPSLYRDFISFVTEQARIVYGRDLLGRYLIGISQGGWQVQRMLEGDEPLVDGVLVVAPWSPVAALQSYPAVLTEVEKLHSEFDRIAGGSLARLDASKLLIVEKLFGLGLPAGSETSWPAVVDFWVAAASAAQTLIDPTYPAGQAISSYALPLRPAAVRNRADGLTPTGELSVPMILLQGELDVFALPVWSSAYTERVRAEERDRYTRVFVFPDADHRLRADSETDDYIQVRLHRAWESLVGWVESGTEPQVILGVDPVVASGAGDPAP